MRRRARWLTGVLMVTSAAGLAGCSGSPPSTAPAATVHAAGLGAPLATWTATRPSTGDGGYGRTITVDGTPTAEFTHVTTVEGRVTGWQQAFPAGTRLADAEASLRAALPADARQTASWRGDAASGGGTCEFVNYQSDLLASRLRTAAPAASGSNIGASFTDDTTSGTPAPVITTVNTARAGTAPYVEGQPC